MGTLRGLFLASPKGKTIPFMTVCQWTFKRVPIRFILSKMGASFRAFKSIHGIRDAETNHRDQWMTAGIAETFQLRALIEGLLYTEFWRCLNKLDLALEIQFGLNPRLLLLHYCQRCCKGHVIKDIFCFNSRRWNAITTVNDQLRQPFGWGRGK